MNPIENTLRELLAQNPDSDVVAIGALGLIIDMPEFLGIESRMPDGAKVGVDLVHPTSRAAMVNQFVYVLQGQVNQQPLIGLDGQARVVYVFDFTDTYHLCVVVSIPGDQLRSDIKTFLHEERHIESRYCRVLYDEHGNVLELDPQFPPFLGYEKEECLGRNITSLVHEDHKNFTIANWYKVLFKETPRPERWRARVSTKSGEWLWVEFTVSNHLHDSTSPHVLVEMSDVTGEVQALEELHASRELLERLTDILPVGVVHFDVNLKITYLNDRIFEMFNIERNYQEAPRLSRFHKEDRRAVTLAMENGIQGIDSDLTAGIQATDTHSELYVSLSIRSLRNREGEVTGIVVTIQNITDDVLRRKSLERRATFDALTGCLNRDSIYRVMAEELENIGASSRGMAVLFADVDKLKSVNDELGHAAGDDLLREISAAMHSGVRSNDKVGRIGGDEFLILCPDLPTAAQALEIAQRITQLLNGVSFKDQALGSVQVSIGAAWTRRSDLSVDEIVSRADAEMYMSKRSDSAGPTVAII